jgi:hypothetical protein
MLCLLREVVVMDGLLIPTAVLIVIVGLAHSVLGEKYLIGPLCKRDDLPRLRVGGPGFAANTLRFAWHITTVAWFGLAWLLVLADRGEVTTRGVLDTVAVVAAISGVISLIGARGRHLSWIAFFAIAAGAWLARH